MLHRILSSARTASSCGRILSKYQSHSSPTAVKATSARHGIRASPAINGSQIRWHGDGPGPDAPTVNITFVNPDDGKHTVAARVGETLLQVSHRTGMEMEGACEGVCACSTCHIILEEDLFDEIQDETEMSEDEEDMLDMAFGLTEYSRLGCQIKVDERMEGRVFSLPKATRNFYVDGHKPIPH